MSAPATALVAKGSPVRFRSCSSFARAVDPAWSREAGRSGQQAEENRPAVVGGRVIARSPEAAAPAAPVSLPTAPAPVHASPAAPLRAPRIRSGTSGRL